MSTAQNNYNRALETVRVDTLLKKVTEDVGIIGGIVIDLAKDFAVDKLGDVLGKLQKMGLAALDDAPKAGEYGPVRMNKRQDLFAKLTDARISASIKKIADPAKKAFTSSVGENAEISAEKAEDLTLIRQLTENMDIYFETLKETVPAEAADAELVWLWQAFRDIQAHSKTAYENALRAKIARFHKSGIDKIGRRNVNGRLPEGQGAALEGISRLTRVCAIHYTSGHPAEHWLETWDQDRDKIRRTEGLLAEERGQVDGIEFKQASTAATPGPGLLKRIPDEFIEIALQRQEQVYADRSMGIRVIDESDYPDMRYGVERYQKAHLQTKGPLPPKGDPLGFAPTPANGQQSVSSKPAQPAIPAQPTSFADPDRAPIIPPTGPLGFGDA